MLGWADSWDPVAGTCTATLQGHRDWVTALAVLEGGRLASVSEDRTVKIWDVANGTCTTTLQGHGDSVPALVRLDGGRFACAGDRNAIKVWDTLT